MVPSASHNPDTLYQGAHMTKPTAGNASFLPLPTERFDIPQQWQGKQTLLIPASPKWVELDFAAVIASQSKLKHLFGPTDSWPPEDLDIESDRLDLVWHEQEFHARQSFAYHLLNHDASRCLGCLYIYPTASPNHDAEAYLWTHLDLSATEANLIESEVIDWITLHWPFTAIAWPGRSIPFNEWEDAAIPNYYATFRMLRVSP